MYVYISIILILYVLNTFGIVRIYLQKILVYIILRIVTNAHDYFLWYLFACI